MKRIMKRIIFSILAIALVFTAIGCGDEGSVTGNGIIEPTLKVIHGRAEKGPLQKGAIIQAAQWHPATGYSGAVFVSATIDDLGGYTLEGSTISGYLDASADGFFINENTGTVSSGRIILSGLIDSATQTEGNINIITHIIKLRVKFLIQGGLTFAQANNQAVAELFSVLDWPPENPLNTSIATNPRLLFLSAALCKDRTVDQVSSLITDLTADMENGFINISALDNSFRDVDAAGVEANIFAMYGVAPDISQVRADVMAFRDIPDTAPIIRIIDPVPAGDFHYFRESKSLLRLHEGELKTIAMKVTFRQEGEDDIVQSFSCIDFFKIDATIYFSANINGTERNYTQVNNVVAEIEALPEKPGIVRVEFDNGSFSAETIVYQGITCTDMRNITMSSGITRNIMVSDYFQGIYSDHQGLLFVVHDDENIVRESGLYFWDENYKFVQGLVAGAGRMWK